MDIAVIYTIYTHARSLGHTDRLHVRIAGRLLDVRAGRRLGNFEVELPGPANVAPNCASSCRLEIVGANARTLARDLGAVLAAKLEGRMAARRPARGRPSERSHVGLSTAYTLTFVGFDMAEITEIEDRVAAFDGYEHIRPISTSLKTNEYWYETSIPSAQLNRGLRLMLKDMDTSGRVSFGGSRFLVEKIGRRKRR